jgi:CubicO group peptidase (beta-lactamase class C family)
MKKKTFPLSYKITLLLVLLIMAGFAIYIIFGRTEKSGEIAKETHFVAEHLIDSVLAGLSDAEKAGLLLFVKADIQDSTDYIQMIDLAGMYGISSWMANAAAFSYHKDISDSLRFLASVPLTYCVRWDNETPDGGSLPPFHKLISIEDSLFLTNFGTTLSELYLTYGINSIFIPPVFSDTLQNLPSQEFINRFMNLNNRIFDSVNFSPPMIIFDVQSAHITVSDTVITFPGSDLFCKKLKQNNISSFTQSSQHLSGNSLRIKNLDEITEVKEFPESDYNMLMVDIDDIETVFNELTKLMKNSKYAGYFDQKIRQVIAVKLFYEESASLRKLKPVSVESTAWKTISMQLSENISCLLKNEGALFPFANLNATFLVAENCHVPDFHLKMKEMNPDYKYTVLLTDSSSLTQHLKKIKPNNKTIVFIQDEHHRFHFQQNIVDSIAELYQLALIDFSDGRQQDFFTECFHAILIVTHHNSYIQHTAAGIIAGTTNASGVYMGKPESSAFLPSLSFQPIRLKQSFPEDAGLDGALLHQKIDSIVGDAISKGAFPGCQVFAAKDGKIVFNKAYGHHTYNRSQAVKVTDLYDIASVTKIAAATIAAMYMCDRGKLSVNETMRKYFKNTEINYTRIKPDTNVVIDTINLKKIDLNKLIKEKKLPKDTIRINDTLLVTIDSIFSKATPSLNIFTVPIRYILMHYSGISPSLPILPYIQLKKYYLREHGLSETDSAALSVSWKDLWDIRYTNRRTDSSTIQIADHFYLKNRWMDTLWERTKEVGVSGKKYSQYTDLNMILMGITMDTINRMNLDRYLQREIYKPLGLNNIMYKPLDHQVPRSRIVPTEHDLHWRRQVLRGHVHDPSAALLGGISGNAGLFSTAEDLGVLFQMLLNGGTYGGKRYLSENIIQQFIATQTETGRGLGFDKYSQKNIVAPSASKNTYGHTGFTGCCVWVDPDAKLVYVFLSNRVHPSSKNWKINGLRVRQNVHQAFYNACF